MRGIVAADGGHAEEEAARALDRTSGTVNFASMASVLTLACRIHAMMIDAADLIPTLDGIDADLNSIAASEAQP